MLDVAGFIRILEEKKSMKYLVALGALFTCISCNQQQEQSKEKLEQLDKKSAREVTLKTVTEKDSVLHITNQTIWFNGDQIATKSDTLKTAKAPKTWNAVDSSQNLSQVPIFVTVQ